MILGFKPQFKPKILDGTKIHTIREDKQDRWKIGYWIHFACGVRTKNYECFKQDICCGTQKIEIKWIDSTFVRVWVDDRPLAGIEVAALARQDGFENERQFFEWFDKDFKGKIIHWTNFKY